MWRDSKIVSAPYQSACCGGGTTLLSAAQLPRIGLKRAEAIEEQKIVTQGLNEIETVAAHQGNHSALHVIEIVLDRDRMHEEALEIDGLQDRELATFGIDAEIGDVRKTALRHDVVQGAGLDR